MRRSAQPKRSPRGTARETANGRGLRGDAERVNFGPLANWIGFNLRMAQTAAFQAFAREAAVVESTRPGRFATLTLIGENPGISQTALSRANGRDKSTLTPLLNDLVRRGLVKRERTRQDRRAYRLTLTAEGRTVLDRLTECARRHEANLERLIGRADRARFLRILRRISSSLA